MKSRSRSTSGSLDEAEQELIDLDLLEYCRPALESGARKGSKQRRQGKEGEIG